nr:type II toxin-antitoxin system MqsA family antitoxin [uncultured Ruminococcus sp.]
MSELEYPENKADSTTTYVEDLGNCIVIIRNVPCSKCNQCGEVSYNGTVLRQIEQIIDNLKNSLTEVAIVNYKPSVA